MAIHTTVILDELSLAEQRLTRIQSAIHQRRDTLNRELQNQGDRDVWKESLLNDVHALSEKLFEAETFARKIK